MRLSFDSRLYRGEAVQAAVAAYAAFARVSVHEASGAYEVELEATAPDIDPQELADEFANYALGAMRP